MKINLKNYPRLTVIMRGYTYDEAMLIIKLLASCHHSIGVEVTTNNPDYLKIIHDGSEKFGERVNIGAGTVLTSKQATETIDAGAKFMLSPCGFDSDIYAIARNANIITVPAAFSPSEMRNQLSAGADIVKIFPANVLGPDFFKALQGPFGQLPLMAVGGVSLDNARKFFDAGALFLGIGSSFFSKEALEEKDEKKLQAAIDQWLCLLK